MWEKLLFVIGGLAALWWIYHSIRHNPQAFSANNMNRSLYTLGWLALLLIGCVTVVVLLLKS